MGENGLKMPVFYRFSIKFGVFIANLEHLAIWPLFFLLNAKKKKLIYIVIGEKMWPSGQMEKGA